MNVGVIGAGYWGSKIVREYLALADEGRIDRVTICDLDKARFKEFESHPKATFAPTAASLFGSGVDAVNICTANETHYYLARKALDAGLHVLVEKPLATSSREAYELVERSQKAKRVLAVGHIYRFNNSVNVAQKLIQRGDIGDLLHLKLEWSTTCDPIVGRDIVWDLAPHPFDILHYLLGEYPAAVTCRARPIRRPELDEIAYITAEYRDGPLAQIDLSWVTPGKTREIVAVGSHASLHIDTLHQKIRILDGNSEKLVPVNPNNTIRDELLHFIECVALGKTAINGNLVGANVVAVIEETIRSAREGRTRPVEIRLPVTAPFADARLG